MPVTHTRRAGQLNDLEARFVAEYLIDLSQSQALKRAYGDGKKRAYPQLAYRMMQDPDVRAAVDKGLAKQFAKLEATAEDVKREIARMALFDPAHLTGITCPEDIALLPEDVRRCIVGWSWDRKGNFTVKTAKEGAVEMLGRQHGLFRDRHEHSGPNGGPIEGKATLDMSALTMEQLRALASIPVQSS